MKIMYILMILILMMTSAFAYTACDGAKNSINEAVQCAVVSGLGGSFDLFAIFVIGAVILLAFAARLPAALSLMIGISLTFGLDVAFGRSQMLEMLIFLQLIGIVVVIFSSFFNLGKVME